MGEAFIVRRGSPAFKFPGQTEERHFLWDGVEKGSSVVLKINPIKLPNPSVVSSEICYEAALDPNGDYLATAHPDDIPSLYLYKRNGNTFTKLPDPSNLPVSAQSVAWSHNSTYLVVGDAVGSKIAFFKRNGDSFTRLSDPSSLPSQPVTAAVFDPTYSAYVATAVDGSTRLEIYQRSGDTFSKLTNISAIPSSEIRCLSFDPSVGYLAVGMYSSPFIHIYKIVGDSFIQLSNPSTLPAGTVMGLSWDRTSTYLAVAHSSSPYLTIYKRSGDTFTKLPNPSELPGVSTSGAVFDPFGSFLMVSLNSGGMMVYRRIGDTFAKLPDPQSSFSGNKLSLSKNGFLAGLTASNPYFAVYAVNSVFNASSYSLAAPDVCKAGYALESGIEGDYKKIMVFFRAF